MVECDLLFSFVKAARAAGPNLTKASARTAFQQMGPFSAAFWGGGSFRPGKFDMADQVQVHRWYYSCKCFKPAQPFEASRY